MAEDYAADMDTDDSLVSEGKDLFKACDEAWSKNREAFLEDLKFARLSEQWPDTVAADRKTAQRPALTLNFLPAFLRQVVNDARQNKPQIRVQPVDDEADPETAEIFNGLIRNIETVSSSDVATDTAIDSATSGGFGFMKVNLEYTADDTFDQDIVIGAVPNPLSILGDPDYSGADSANWNTAFEIEEPSRKQFERRWKGADVVDWKSGDYSRLDNDWCAEKKVRVASWWARDEVRKKLLAVKIPAQIMPLPSDAPVPVPSDGGVIPVYADVYKQHQDFFTALGAEVVGQPRDVVSHKVTQRIMSGVEILETIEWAGKYIPIIPVYGDVVNVEGKVHLRSLIRDAKDAQQQCNFWETTATEAVSNAPKAPFVGPEEAFQGIDQSKWERANQVAYPYLSHPAYDEQGRPIAPPQRQSPAFAASAEMAMAGRSHDTIKAILGLYDASLGQRSNETSGRAILARQREGDTSTFHFTDNLTRAIRHMGRVIIDLIPHVYSAERVIRVLGEDGTPKPVQIGRVPPEQAAALKQRSELGQDQEEAAEIARIYDLTVGKYDLVVSAGPSFNTKREESASQMIELIRNYPAAAPLIGDLLAKNLDWPGADEIAKRLKAMLPPQVQGQNPELQAAQQQLQALQGQLQQMADELKREREDRSLEAAKVEADATDKAEQRKLEERKIEIDEFKAETDRMKALAPKGVGLPAGSEEAITAMVLKTIGQLLDSPDLITAGEDIEIPEFEAPLEGEPPEEPAPEPMEGQEQLEAIEA
jgi:Uncharacterized protein conserved in bacteria with the myosin-like domain